VKQKLKKKFPNLYRIYRYIIKKINLKKYEKYSKYDYEQMEEKLSEMYYTHQNKRLNWNNLETYTEKMQWAKLYDNDSLKEKLSDKYKVRSWVSNKIGDEYLIPLLGVWEKFNDIDFNSLPNKFVLKTNHGTKTNLIVENKNKLNKRKAKKLFDYWMKVNYGYRFGFQLHYSNIKPLIIAEKFVQDKNGELNDYRFMCFDGTPYYCLVDDGTHKNHKRNIYNMKWELQSWNQGGFKNTAQPMKKPINYNNMVLIAKQLSENFPHVRVDLYNVDGKIYFGEMTFTNSSGFQKIEPIEYDYLLGELWELNSANNHN